MTTSGDLGGANPCAVIGCSLVTKYYSWHLIGCHRVKKSSRKGTRSVFFHFIFPLVEGLIVLWLFAVEEKASLLHLKACQGELCDIDNLKIYWKQLGTLLV